MRSAPDLLLLHLFFFKEKIIVLYKCSKERGFGGEEGGEKEVRKVGKEKNSEKKGKIERRM